MEIPPTFKETKALPCIVPNDKFNCMGKRKRKISVDVHMHRICGRLGWAKTKCSSCPVNNLCLVGIKEMKSLIKKKKKKDC
ncbi:hypothetical protein DICPUDRAFT_154475 [Dictyostelium purpureum]|uniref:Uncharacterized protein n=1 Tax=Dictyostelium purpureum TaxID=5786 RepID=F0ZRF2_DICPU|nr:uncharacterized protein DICPUDRAFT_154475 [Dictyostelium purpureum]EGC33470.1 hypothetical protein DICPUDRAFT_154475 [Dictyostelium purpureum]|eukprot:XP_003289993.1 hypothetical protein DICPUDRAFT_154475 [Dictyostelium purpureum]